MRYIKLMEEAKASQEASGANPDAFVEPREQHEWTPKENELLKKLRNEKKPWKDVAAALGLTEKQCRHQLDKLHPKKDKRIYNPWTPEEDASLIEKVKEHGQNWKKIAPFFPGRNAETCRWHYARLMKEAKPGID
jgi:hypothetical protein